ncbi:unnamed protein product [Ceratitis capitata]|uniref:(Mediterranean fruit fly) hypothetical protein n=1 Tax=Ceratitis capitata TaxID=7213 RepID=A0A811UZ49_CERCA|nr:unnamed protein product [Ceratitis capitata]
MNDPVVNAVNRSIGVKPTHTHTPTHTSTLPNEQMHFIDDNNMVGHFTSIFACLHHQWVYRDCICICDDAGSWRMAGCATARVVECFNADAVDDAEGDGSDNSAKISDCN